MMSESWSDCLCGFPSLTLQQRLRNLHSIYQLTSTLVDCLLRYYQVTNVTQGRAEEDPRFPWP